MLAAEDIGQTTLTGVYIRLCIHRYLLWLCGIGHSMSLRGVRSWATERTHTTLSRLRYTIHG